MNERDKQLINAILKHYGELLEELENIHTLEEFVEQRTQSKAIKLDLLQIGENVNHLSEESKLQLLKRDLVGIIDIRNQVAHGYITLEDNTIWETLHVDLPVLIEQIKNIQ